MPGPRKFFTKILRKAIGLGYVPNDEEKEYLGARPEEESMNDHGKYAPGSNK